MEKKKLTVLLMDAPFETQTSTTAFRILSAAAKRGWDLHVFAYEGAAALAFARQQPHANAVHGRDAAQENHPNTKDWVTAIHAEAQAKGGSVDWINCGLCVDERGVGEFAAGRRGSPADFHQAIEETDNVLVIPTR